MALHAGQRPKQGAGQIGNIVGPMLKDFIVQGQQSSLRGTKHFLYGDFGAYLDTNIGIARKDLGLAAGLGLESGRPMPVVEAVGDAMDLVYGMPED